MQHNICPGFGEEQTEGPNPWLEQRWLLSGFGVMTPDHVTRAPTRLPRRALPRRRALCTNSKKPRWSGSFSCEMPRCGRSQERSKDQVPSMVLTYVDPAEAVVVLVARILPARMADRLVPVPPGRQAGVAL